MDDDQKIKTTCLHRFLGECPSCREDTDACHHPNNLDCPRYHRIAVAYFEVRPILEADA